MPQTLTSPVQQLRTHYERKTCILCLSPHLSHALPLPKTPVGNDYVPANRLEEDQPCFCMDLYRCEDCGNLQIRDVVNPDLLFRAYTYSTSHSLGLVDHFRQVAQEYMRRFNPPSGSLVIDIGSNDGSLLRAFKAEGMQVLGIDPAVSIAQTATENGIPTVPDFFTAPLAKELLKDHGPAKIITANNVFAHSDKLPEMADGIRILLASDGVFSFEVSYLVDIVQKMLFDTVYHEHLCYHTVRSLKSFFQRHGLELIQIDRIPTKGGSIRGTVQRQGGPRPVSPLIANLLGMEDAIGLHTPGIWARYRRQIDENKNQVNEVLNSLKSRGKTIAGYGASPTVTTLLHHYDIADKLEYLLDDNAVKQNTYSPGQHIPVYASEHLYKKPVDYVALLAWQYAQPIMKRHQKYIENGGHFVIPLALMQVV